VRQRLRRLLRRLGPPVAVYNHPTFRIPLPTSHIVPGMSARRAHDVLTWAVDLGVVGAEEVHQAAEISWVDASRVHTEAWLRSLDDARNLAAVVGVPANLISVSALIEMWRRGTGATLQAARWALQTEGRAFPLMGGFHHAAPDRGVGFSALNDIAIAVAVLRSEGFDQRVLVIDLDAHPPDGTVACLAEDPDVTVLSLGVASEWTVDPAAAALVIDHRVPPGCTTDAYLDALEGLLASVPDAPRLAFYLAGADPLQGDPLGGLAVSAEGLRQRDRVVFSTLKGVPTVVLPGGGYLDRSWRILAATLAEGTGLRTAVAPAYDPVVRRTRDVMKTLDPDDLGTSDDVFITEEELFGALRVPTAEPRFLGFYTRHGLEHALEAYDFLGVLRRMGFAGLQLEIEVTDGPDRMRLTADVEGEQRVLMDLAVAIRPVASWRTLFIEWLELRDPRVGFTADRPQLPGQAHPGLGLAEETSALLTRAAERLGLAGLSMVPSHFHVYRMTSGRFTVADPVARGEARALQAHLEEVDLGRASSMLAEEGVPTTDGAPVQWSPSLAVSARDEGLRGWLRAGDAASRAAQDALAVRLVPV